MAELATYLKHPAFAGHFFADEPKCSYNWKGEVDGGEIKELITAYSKFYSAFPQGDAYINLLPKTSSEFLTKALYESYVKYYMNNFALGENGTGFISYDHYPLHESGITSTHLWNLEYVAGLCRDNNLEFRTYIYSSETGDDGRDIRAIETVNDVYFQIYSALCYGVKEIVYYRINAEEIKDDSIGDATIGQNSLATGKAYAGAKQVNNEVHAFDAAYNNFKWQSASKVGTLSNQSGLSSMVDVGKFGTLAKAEGSHVLIGNFVDADGDYLYGANYAYMVMNYANTDGATRSTDKITLTFNETPTRALVYQGGKAKVITLDSNKMTLDLQLGEGAFVIPLN